MFKRIRNIWRHVKSTLTRGKQHFRVSGYLGAGLHVFCPFLLARSNHFFRLQAFCHRRSGASLTSGVSLKMAFPWKVIVPKLATAAPSDPPLKSSACDAEPRHKAPCHVVGRNTRSHEQSGGVTKTTKGWITTERTEADTKRNRTNVQPRRRHLTGISCKKRKTQCTFSRETKVETRGIWCGSRYESRTERVPVPVRHPCSNPSN